MKKEKHFIIELDNFDSIVRFFENHLKSCRVFAFYGPLGAGKTTLIRQFLRARGVCDSITSPTFTYVNLYKNASGEKFYHFDLYRIENLKDFLAAGFDEYLHDEEGWSFIEWPEVIEPDLKEIEKKGICKITIDYMKEPNKRKVSCTVY